MQLLLDAFAGAAIIAPAAAVFGVGMIGLLLALTPIGRGLGRWRTTHRSPIRNEGPLICRQPDLFVRNTHPTAPLIRP